MNKSMDLLLLAGSLLACLLAGAIGSAFTIRSIPIWYAGLSKPSFTPPNGVFGPVWSLLYLLMGIALFLIWRKGFAVPGVGMAVVMFVIQLVVNALWSISFFGLRSPFLGLVNIALLWVLILTTLVLFLRLSWLSGLLLVPYFLWVSFASALNFAIWRLNP